MNNLGDRWKLFLSIILDPCTLVLSVSIGGLFSLSIGPKNATITSLLFVLITIASAILGGRITKHWLDITEGGVVKARGSSAVRSLKLLLRNISALEQRVSKFSLHKEDIKQHPEVTIRNYEEIREICNLLEEETVNSIENWTDIVPEADIKTQIGVISELKQSVQEKEDELNGLNAELKDTKGKSDEDRKRLEGEVKRKEKQIATLEREIMDKRIGLGGIGAIGGLIGVGSNSTIRPIDFGTTKAEAIWPSVTTVSGVSDLGNRTK